MIIIIIIIFLAWQVSLYVKSLNNLLNKMSKSQVWNNMRMSNDFNFCMILI